MPNPATEATAPPNTPAQATSSSNIQRDPCDGGVAKRFAGDRPRGERRERHARRTREREFGELNRDFQRKQREFREDLNQRRNEELAQVVEQANRVIRLIAEQEKFDIIFQEMPAYVSPRIDITDKVIKALDGKPPAK